MHRTFRCFEREDETVTYLRYAPRADDVVGYYDESMGAFCATCLPTDPDADPLALPIFRDDVADAPTHCEGCRALLPHKLTDDGRAYVLSALQDGTGDRDVLTEWADAYGVTLEDVLALDVPHVWRRSTFGTATVCDACHLLPLDADDVATACPGKAGGIFGA